MRDIHSKRIGQAVSRKTGLSDNRKSLWSRHGPPPEFGDVLRIPARFSFSSRRTFRRRTHSSTFYLLQTFIYNTS